MSDTLRAERSTPKEAGRLYSRQPEKIFSDRTKERLPLRERPYATLHAVFKRDLAHPNSGLPVEGFVYLIEEKRIFVVKDTEELFLLNDENRLLPFHEGGVCATYARMRYREDICTEAYNRGIKKARDVFAKQLANQDQVYTDILRRALEKCDGEPLVPDMHYKDIPLFQTGENATHTIYEGYKDGIHYRLVDNPFDIENGIEHPSKEEGLSDVNHEAYQDRNQQPDNQRALSGQRVIIERERHGNVVELTYAYVQNENTETAN